MYVTKDLFGILVTVKCECDKSCDVGEYLDYENCSFRKKLVDKLIDECIENIDEAKIAEIISTELHSLELHSTKYENKNK